MDQFFEKWGWLVVAGVILAIVIAMMSPLGDFIWEQIEMFITKFATYVSGMDLMAPATPGTGA